MCKSIFQKYLEHTILYVISSKYFLAVCQYLYLVSLESFFDVSCTTLHIVSCTNSVSMSKDCSGSVILS